MEKKTVELQPAYVWTCDECGHENLERLVFRDAPEDQLRKALIEDGKLEEWQETPADVQLGDCMVVPDSMRCRSCGEEYDPLIPGFEIR